MFVKREKVIFLANNKSSYCLACSVKMVGYWHCSVLCFLLKITSSRSIKKQKGLAKSLHPIHVYNHFDLMFGR